MRSRGLSIPYMALLETWHGVLQCQDPIADCVWEDTQVDTCRDSMTRTAAHPAFVELQLCLAQRGSTTPIAINPLPPARNSVFGGSVQMGYNPVQWRCWVE